MCMCGSVLRQDITLLSLPLKISFLAFVLKEVIKGAFKYD